MMIVFVPVFGQNSTTIENQNITIKTEVQENPTTAELLKELVETQKTQDVRFNQLIESLDITNTDDSIEKWTEDGLLTSSATIIGFTGFSTLLVIKFQNYKIPEKLSYLKSVFVSIGGIVVLHVYAMCVVIFHVYNNHDFIIMYPVFYTLALLATAVGFCVALISMFKITKLENEYVENQSSIQNILNLLDGVSLRS